MSEVKKKVLVIGSISLASRVLQRLISDARCEIVGVVFEDGLTRKPHDVFDEPLVSVLVHNFALPRLRVTDVEERFADCELDMAISCRAPYILKPRFLRKFKSGVVNMHGGLLPECRGVHNANHVVIDGLGFSGATLHFMDEGIDTGPIIARKRFDVSPTATAFDVFCQTQEALWELFVEQIDALLEGTVTAEPQEESKFLKYYDSKALSKTKRLDLSMDADRILRVVQGNDFPGHEPAYLLINDTKVFLTTRSFFLHETDGSE